MRRAILLAALLAGACSQVPDYARPTSALPPAFKEAPGWRPADPADARPRGDWWAMLGDPVLDDLERRVARANQEVAQAAGAYAQARALVREQRSTLFPTLDLSASGRRVGSFGSGGGGGTVIVGGTGGTSTAVGGGGGAQNRFAASIGASWEPDLFGRISAGLAQTRANAQASAADLGNVILAAQGELALNYLQLRSLDAQGAILADTIAAYARNVQITTNRYDAGVVARVDILQAESQLRSARADAADLGRQRALLEHAIAVLVGETPSLFALPPAARWSPVVPQSPAILPAALLERRPDVAAAERRVSAANAAIGVERAAFFPTIGLTGSVGGNASSVGGLFRLSNSIWSFGADIAQTLLDFGGRRARVAQARAAWEQAVAQYRQAVLVAFQDVEDQLAAVRILADVAGERTAAAEAATRTEQLVRNQYLAGLVGYSDVIVAQATALAARQAAVTATLDRQTAAVALTQAIGGGWQGIEPVAGDAAPPPATGG